MYTHRGNPIRFKYYNRIITVYSLEDSSLAKRNMKYIWMRVIKKYAPSQKWEGGRESLLSSPHSQPVAYLRLLSFQLVRRTAYERLRIEILRLCYFSCLPSFFSRISSFPNSLSSCLSTSRTPVGLLISRLAKALDRRLTHLDRPIVNYLILIKLLTWSVNFVDKFKSLLYIFKPNIRKKGLQSVVALEKCDL